MPSLFRAGLALTAALAFVTVIALAGSTSGQAAWEPRRVLMLHSFGPRFKPWTDHARVIRSQISRNMRGAVDFHDHSLLEARNVSADSEGPFVDYLSALYASKHPDLIITIGAPAASFVQRHRPRLFPGVPLLLTAASQRRVEMDKLTENDAVVGVYNDHRAALENILRVLPLTKTIKIVSGVSPIETWLQNELRRDFARLAERVEIKWYNNYSFDQILNDAAQLRPHSAIYWLLLSVDAAGIAHEESSALDRLAAVANAPIFTHNDAFFGEAIVGGPMQSVEHGVSAAGAAVAVRILNGERAGDIKTPPVTFASPKFDWRQMQRWGIRESDLPPGSTVFFKPPSVWETYRWQLLTILAALLFQGAVILFLLERHRRQAAEMQSQQRMMELAHVNRFSTAGEMAASIAHEINQPLGAILNNVETAEIMLRSHSPDLGEMRNIVGDIRRDNARATEVIRHLRSYVKKVPSVQRRFDLNDEVAEAVKFLTPEARSRGVILRSKLASVPLPVSGDPIQLEQVLSNLILNAMDAMSERSQPEKVVVVETALDGSFAQVWITDTGPGIASEIVGRIFDPFYSTKKEGMGMGLSIVRSIVEAHHGKIRTENSYHGGAVFHVSLPLA